jgi:hypothetical protein
VHLGPAVGAFRELGERGEHVDVSDALRRGLEPLHRRRHFAPELAEQPRLQRQDPVLGVQGLRLPLLQLGRDVPFGVGQRLLPLVVGGHPVEVRPRDLEVVAEDLVESDLERRDAVRSRSRVCSRAM